MSFFTGSVCAMAAVEDMSKAAIKADVLSISQSSFVVVFTPSLAGARKIFQVRRPLSLLGGHQQPVTADHVVLLADLHMIVALAAYCFNPQGLAIGLPAIGLAHQPWSRQGIVDHGHIEDESIGVALVQVDAFFHNRLIVIVQRNAAGIVSARPREAAGLDLEQVELAVAVGIDPLADGIAEQG